jgi:predicted MFS family arabinose efflux permease
MLAFLLLPIYGFRNVFLIAFIPGIIAVLAIFLIREDTPAAQPVAQQSSLKVSLRALPPNLRLFIVASALFAFGHYGYAFLLLKVLSTGASDSTALLYYVLFYGVYTFCTIPAGIASDRVGRKPVIMAGYLMFGLLSAGLIVVTGSAILPVFFAVYGIFFAFIDGAQRAFIVDMAPSDLKATALGTFHTAIGLVALPGGFIAGMLWDVYSPAYTFLFGVILAALALGLMTVVKNTAGSPA